MTGMLLAVDTASPTVSVAIGDATGLAVERQIPLKRSSELLLAAIEDALGVADLELRELDGLLALRGPGSFTGLRVGLSTVLGLHQALGLRATAISTFSVLALSAGGAPHLPVIAAVDALRGDWYVQPFTVSPWPLPAGEPSLKTADQLAGLAPCRLIGHQLDALRAPLAKAPIDVCEAPPLAGLAVRLATHTDILWDANLLTRPIYFRPPAVTLPRPRPTG